MAIGNISVQPYMNDLVLPKDAVKTVLPEKKDPVITETKKTDSLNISNISEKSITSNLEIEIKDKDGFLTNSKDDIDLKISGTTKVSKNLIMKELSGLDIKGIEFKQPSFDPERKQYVIKGKALDVVLGIDVGFEIRIGEKNGKLAVRVDNDIKRGIIYKQLGKEFEKLGIETYRGEHLLFVKPEYKGTLDIPISKDKTQKARIESISSNSDNTKFSIDKTGNITITLKDVAVKASSDPTKVNEGKKEINDAGFIKFDFSADDKLNPELEIKDADIKVNVENQDLGKIVGEKTEKQIEAEFGKVSSVEIKDLNGKVNLDGKKIDADINTHIEVNTVDSDSKISTDVKIEVDDKQIKSVTAENTDIKAKDNTITAEKITYSGTKGSINVDAEGVKGNVKREGIDAKIDADITIKKENTTLSAEIDGNIKGNVDKKDLKADVDVTGKTTIEKTGDNITASVDGKITGNVTQKDLVAKVETDGVLSVNKNKENIDINLDGNVKGYIQQGDAKGTIVTSGKHDVKFEKGQADIKIDKVSVEGDFIAPKKKKVSPEKVEKMRDINVDIKEFDVKGNLKLDDLAIKTEINNGGVKANVTDDKINIESSATIKIEANSEKIKGKAETTGTTVQIDNKTGKLDIKADNVKAEGSFEKKQGGLSVSGKINGDISANMSNGSIKIKEENGNFDAKFKKRDKIDVHGKGKNADFSIDKNDDVDIKLTDVDAKTKLKLNKNLIDVDTKGKEVYVSTKGDDVNITTKQSKSNLDIKINKSIEGKGTVGDVSVKVTSNDKGDNVDIKAKNADLTAHIKNKKDNLGVDVKTSADINVKVVNDDVSIFSKNAKQTKVDFHLKDKIETKADGKDFSVEVKETEKTENIDIKLKQAVFDGKIHPNPRINANVSGKTREDLKVNINDTETGTDVKVGTKSEIKGDVSVNNKIKANFDNKTGFDLLIKDEMNSPTEIEAKLDDLNLDGAFNSTGAKVDIKGAGDFKFNLKEGAGKDPDVVNVNYKGKLGGNLDAKETAKGSYQVNGDFNLNANGDDINITTIGDINAKTDKTKFGVNTDISLSGTDDAPIKVNIDDSGDKTKVNVSNAKGGFINLNNIDQLNMGKDDPNIKKILEVLKSKSAKISYQNLEVEDGGKKLAVNVQTKEMETKYGSINTGMIISKNDSKVQIEKGVVSLTPNIELFNLIKDELSSKYNIKMNGVPELKNGELNFTGEIKSKSGITQVAKFNLKATIVDNSLVLDIGNAKVMQVLGKNTITNLADRILNRTDIEHVRVDKSSIKINLADLVKDLSSTAGINFTGIKLDDNKIKIGFKYNSIDQEIGKLGKNKDVSGTKEFMKNVDYNSISGESISTAFNTIAASKNVNDSVDFVSNLVSLYIKDNGKNPEIARGLNWVSKSAIMKNGSIGDDVTMALLKQIKVRTPEGDNIIRSLPVEVVKNLAENLDTTISQILRFSFITPQERMTANYIRRLKGIPENNRVI